MRTKRYLGPLWERCLRCGRTVALSVRETSKQCSTLTLATSLLMLKRFVKRWIRLNDVRREKLSRKLRSAGIVLEVSKGLTLFQNNGSYRTHRPLIHWKETLSSRIHNQNFLFDASQHRSTRTLLLPVLQSSLGHENGQSMQLQKRPQHWMLHSFLYAPSHHVASSSGFCMFRVGCRLGLLEQDEL